MLAESMQLQATATIQISNAIDMMAKNEERQNRILELIYKYLTDKGT